MAERKQFTFYESFYTALKRIKKKQDRADAYDLICEYALMNKEPDLEEYSDSVAIAFELLRPVLDSARKKAANGKQGGSKTKANGKQIESKTKQPLSEGEKEREIEKEREKEVENEIESESYSAHSDGSLFTSFWNAYPEVRRYGREEAWEAWKRLEPTTDTAEEINGILEAWKASRQWTEDGGSFIPAPKNFLDPARGYLHNKPTPAKQKECGWGPEGRPLDEDDIAAIKRMMEMPDTDDAWGVME